MGCYQVRSPRLRWKSAWIYHKEVLLDDRWYHLVCCSARVREKEGGEEPGREQPVFSLRKFIKKRILIIFALPGIATYHRIHSNDLFLLLFMTGLELFF